MLFGFHKSMITTTIVAGRILMHDRKLTTLDEAAVTNESRRRVAAVWGNVATAASFVRGVRELCDRYDVLLCCDEVATGFGRTGTMFAVEQAGVAPDLLCLAKGLTAGYLPLAATLATERIFSAFRGPYTDYRALYHGHTYGGNPLACAAALANLEVFDDERTVARAHANADSLATLLEAHVAPLAHVGPVRRVGVMAGFDLWKDYEAGVRFPAGERRAHQAALAARERGLSAPA